MGQIIEVERNLWIGVNRRRPRQLDSLDQTGEERETGLERAGELKGEEQGGILTSFGGGAVNIVVLGEVAGQALEFDLLVDGFAEGGDAAFDGVFGGIFK